MQPRHVAAACLAVALSSPGSVRAALFEGVTVEQAARTSDAVVHGRVERRESREDGAGRIVTDVEIAAAGPAWKGAPGDRLLVTVPGGTVGGLAMWVSAAPRLEVGDEVVLFLAARGAEWRVNGLALGALRVEGGEAHPVAEKADVLDPARVPAGEKPLGPMSLAELERRVRSAK